LRQVRVASWTSSLPRTIRQARRVSTELCRPSIGALRGKQGGSNFSKVDILVGSNREEVRLCLLPNGMLEEARSELRASLPTLWMVEPTLSRTTCTSLPTADLLSCSAPCKLLLERACAAHRLIAKNAAEAACDAYLHEFRPSPRGTRASASTVADSSGATCNLDDHIGDKKTCHWPLSPVVRSSLLPLGCRLPRAPLRLNELQGPLRS
jgi:hypothetical protein